MSGEPQIRFDDGAAYERYMGVWSRKVGEAFLDWLAPPPGLSWIDVGCGNGAFTALLAERTRPAAILGVDPSPAQLDYARTRPGVEVARFEAGHAMELPAADASADAAAMALVIAFVPDPAKGVAEMRRTVRPGGLIGAYMWDWPAGFPFQLFHEMIEAKGLPAGAPPSWKASHLPELDALWRGAGLQDVETREIAVERHFPDLETLWAITLTSPRLSTSGLSQQPALIEEMRQAVKARLGVADGEPITLSAKANAVKGRVPASSAPH